MAEGGGLLNRYTVNSRIVGSNPIPSARLLEFAYKINDISGSPLDWSSFLPVPSAAVPAVVPVADLAPVALVAWPAEAQAEHRQLRPNAAKHLAAIAAIKAKLDAASGVSTAGHSKTCGAPSARTRLSALPIEDRVGEAMIAHAAPGLYQVYDQHAYRTEKRRGFKLYEADLRKLLDRVRPRVEAAA